VSAQAFELTGAIVAGAALASYVTDFIVRSAQAERYAWQRRLRAWLGVAPGRRMGELGWAAMLLHLAIWSLAGYLILQVWQLAAIATAIGAAFHAGFVIDGMQVVPLRILLGLVWFVLLVTFTRWLNRKVSDDWLTRTRVETSTRESIATLFGYGAFVVAAFVGLSAAGVNLDRLAIVAGALSVGVGFGLQNIVSNFVSGIILLFEQPIRNGDYISVGETAGFVRKIRIRATEIETWDRESILVPNSMLLSTPVKNLNLRDDYGRLTIKVGVAYGSDVQKVKALLTQAANEHSMTVKEGEHLSIPGPTVLFFDFGDSALQFQLRVFISPVTQSIQVASDLRFAIDELFRRHGVVMPFPQQDVHFYRGSPP
jgi:small-conductance mechanosensitive channel